MALVCADQSVASEQEAEGPNPDPPNPESEIAEPCEQSAPSSPPEINDNMAEEKEDTSNTATKDSKEENDEEKDLEDGEIEDDDGDDDVTETSPPVTETKDGSISDASVTRDKDKDKDGRENKERPERDRPKRDRSAERRARHEDGKKMKHMTEAEKSILHLRRRERIQRERWEKMRKDTQPVVAEAPIVDDFAINLEKAIASVLKKDKGGSEDEDRNRKRKISRDGKQERSSRVSKQRKLDSPSSREEGDDTSISPRSEDRRNNSGGSENESYDSDESNSNSDRKSVREHATRRTKGRGREKKRKKSRERRTEQQLKDAQGVCVFFLQGKCQKNDCPYSHEAVPPMKLELCKFYLMECCAKGEKCSYMHSEFPCKFYHTGLPCLQGDNCKFAHGKPLTEGLKQILFKHIETAPREILGGFPRMSRDEALNMINVTQQSLNVKYGIVSDKKDLMFTPFDVPIPQELMAMGGEDKQPKNNEKPRSRPSRWQDPDPLPMVAPSINMNVPPPIGGPFNYGRDQDMRIGSNGDVDMRTLPPLALPNLQIPPQVAPPVDLVTSTPDLADNKQTNFAQDVDIRNPSMIQFDTDIRQKADIPDLPETQRNLYMRIQAQQKTNVPEEEPEMNDDLNVDNINWYSDDDDEDDDNRLTIKDEEEDNKKEDFHVVVQPQEIVKPADVVERLGDLSKIDISAEVTKLLTTITQTTKPPRVDPRQKALPNTAANIIQQITPLSQQVGSTNPPISQLSSPPRQSSARISIYDQSNITSTILNEPASPDPVDTDLIRSTRPDIDLRNLALPFKGMMNYTPAKEIDASVNSHPPVVWKVYDVDIPRPDYTGLKLNVQEAEKTGDPRLKKIFKLNATVEDSPASPKAARIDPRLKKNTEPAQANQDLTYNQQLNILQSSAFFQSLTSNQKVLLTQELAMRNEQNTSNDPILSSLLSNLNLIPGANMNPTNMGVALGILANVTKLNPVAMLPMGGGLLGAAPGIPNMGAPPADFQMPFGGPGGLLGNPPPQAPPFGNFQQQPPPDSGFNNEFYVGQSPDFNRDRYNNRDRRRGGGRNNFNNRNNQRNFRNQRNGNRNNRGHTPP